MGSRISRRQAERRQDGEAGNPAQPTPVASEAKLAAQAQEAFMTTMEKHFRRKVLCSKRRRVEIKGKADQYPYWMSTHNLQKHSGDHHKNTSTELKYYLVQLDGEQVPGHGKIPIYFYQQLRKTLKLQLKFKDSNMSHSKQESHPEHNKLKRSVRTLLLNITADKKMTRENGTLLDIKLYEQHFRARKKPQLRPMKCESFYYDQRGNLAIVGDEFLLTVNKPKLTTERPDLIQGTYLRSLDTTLHAIIKYTYTQNDACGSSTIQLPNNDEHYDEYAKLLLSKSSKELFTVNIPKAKKER